MRGGSFGGPGWLQVLRHAWEKLGAPAHLGGSTSLFAGRCFVEMEKGRGGNNTSGMSGAVGAPAANREREQ